RSSNSQTVRQTLVCRFGCRPRHKKGQTEVCRTLPSEVRRPEASRLVGINAFTTFHTNHLTRSAAELLAETDYGRALRLSRALRLTRNETHSESPTESGSESGSTGSPVFSTRA